MRLKSFTAPTMREAMQMVRDTLGEDAIIISTYRGGRGRGVQITAAIEPEPEPKKTRPGSGAPDDGGHNGKAPGSAAAAQHGLGEAPLDSTASFDADFLHQALLYHGLSPLLTERLCQLAASHGSVDTVLALAAALDHMFAFNPMPVHPQRPIMLVGPPGAGKTVTVAKLAARAALEGRPVHVMTTDTVRAGAVDQLSCFTDLLETPLHSITSCEELRAAVTAKPAGEALFIDSPGTNPYSESEIKDLAGFVKAIDVEPILLLPAGSDPNEAAEIAQSFAALGVRRLVSTRLDMARRLGGMLTAARGGNIALADVSITPFVAHGLSGINPVALARLLLRDPTRPDQRPEFDKAGQ